jgi:hypothetical protein
MNDGRLRLDIAEALGRANAIISFQAALTAMLVSKKLLTAKDAAELTGTASTVLAEMEGLSVRTRASGESALRDITRIYTKKD